MDSLGVIVEESPVLQKVCFRKICNGSMVLPIQKATKHLIDLMLMENYLIQSFLDF